MTRQAVESAAPIALDHADGVVRFCA